MSETSGGVAPSWSWASIEGEIGKQYHSADTIKDAVSTVDDIQTNTSIRKSAEDTQACVLLVTGYLRRVAIHDNHGEESTFPPIFNHKRDVVIYQDQRQARFEKTSMQYYLDSNIAQDVIDAYVLFIAVERQAENESSRSSAAQPGRLHGLLLHQIGPDMDTHQRIGTISVDGFESVAVKYNIRPNVTDWDDALEKMGDSFRHQGPQSHSYESVDSADETLRASREELNDGVERSEGSPHAGHQEGDDGDIAEKLYAYGRRYVDHELFERLTPRTVKLL
ncbi:MAG: hypothetical protein Q9213_005357 [Squamulea squamosa]